MKNIAEMIQIPNMRNIFLLLGGALILAFGLYNIHSFSGVTEGGVLGLTLLLRHLFDISPAVSGFVINALCYLIGAKVLGGRFIICSVIAGGGFSLFYAIFEHFGPIYPDIAEYPLAASLVGAVFVGTGVGLCVRGGGAPTGDDALAMSISYKTGGGVERIYLISDLAVLLLSLMYIPLGKIMYSVLTAVISGQIIGFVQRLGKKR